MNDSNLLTVKPHMTYNLQAEKVPQIGIQQPYLVDIFLFVSPRHTPHSWIMDLTQHRILSPPTNFLP